MISRFSPLLRTLPSSSMATRVPSRAFSTAAILPLKLPHPPHCLQPTTSPFGRTKFNCNGNFSVVCGFGLRRNGIVPASRREYRKVRMKKVAVAAAKKSTEKELELSVQIGIEEQLPEDSEIMIVPRIILLRLACVIFLVYFFLLAKSWH